MRNTSIIFMGNVNIDMSKCQTIWIKDFISKSTVLLYYFDQMHKVSTTNSN